MLKGGPVGLLFAAREAPGDVRKLQENEEQCNEIIKFQVPFITDKNFFCLLFPGQHESFDYPVCLVQIRLVAAGLLLFEAGRVSALEILLDAPVESNSVCYST